MNCVVNKGPIIERKYKPVELLIEIETKQAKNVIQTYIVILEFCTIIMSRGVRLLENAYLYFYNCFWVSDKNTVTVLELFAGLDLEKDRAALISKAKWWPRKLPNIRMR